MPNEKIETLVTDIMTWWQQQTGDKPSFVAAAEMLALENLAYYRQKLKEFEDEIARLAERLKQQEERHSKSLGRKPQALLDLQTLQAQVGDAVHQMEPYMSSTYERILDTDHGKDEKGYLIPQRLIKALRDMAQ